MRKVQSSRHPRTRRRGVSQLAAWSTPLTHPQHNDGSNAQLSQLAPLADGLS